MNVRHGFTLIELVVVILILGILAGVAAPKLVDTSAAAADNSLRHSLSVIRDAIQFYAQEHGALPGASDGAPRTFKSDLAPYLPGSFPAVPLGPAAGDRRVRMKSDGVPLTGNASPNRAWKYDLHFLRNRRTAVPRVLNR